MLRSLETDEYLRTTESAFRRASEREQAEKAVESARSAAGAILISTQNEPQRSRLTKPVRLQMMRKAPSRLNMAKKSLRAIRRGGDLITNFIRGTWDYKTAQRNVKRQGIRLQWILEQIPRIEAELNESKAAESSSNAERGTRRRLGRDHDDEVTTNRKPTKPRRNDQGLRSDGRAGSTTQAKGRSKRNHLNDTIDDEQPSKRFRMNTRDSDIKRQAFDDADTALTRSLQASGVPAARRQNGDGKIALETSLERGQDEIINHRSPKRQAATISRREESTRNALQSSITSQQLRRSARITAY